jgi:hypothetical protein
VIRWLPLGARQRLALGALVALGPLLAILYLRYQLSRYLGALIDGNLLLALAGGTPLEWFAQASAQLVPVADDASAADRRGDPVRADSRASAVPQRRRDRPARGACVSRPAAVVRARSS